ncbi:MAG: hypothetical protein L3J05_04620, partial [Robiginitomaculum sp.]|nr:hypothetical protein [Robiginitomaculum sp.]
LQCTFACLVMVGVVLALPPSVNTLPDFAELVLKASVGAVVYGFVAFAINAANCRNLAKDFLEKFKNRRHAKTKETLA